MKLSGYFSSDDKQFAQYQRIRSAIWLRWRPLRIARIPTASISTTRITPTLLFHLGAGLLYFTHPGLIQHRTLLRRRRRLPRLGSAALRAATTLRPFRLLNICRTLEACRTPSFGGGFALGTGFFRSHSGIHSLHSLHGQRYQAYSEHQHDLG